MAYYLQKVTFLFLLSLCLAGAAPKRPFSHKYHLTQVASCQPCHTDAEKSTQAEDNLLPMDSNCVTCHDEVHIKQPRATRIARFSHAQHVKVNPGPLIAAAMKSGTWLGPPVQRPAEVNVNNVCLACHHDIDKSENIIDADGLKHYPRMADCLVCHTKINPPESCKQCHAAATQFRPADHTAAFVDAHAEKGKIDKSTCAPCHGRSVTCKECH
jgi:hypothetical protein